MRARDDDARRARARRNPMARPRPRRRATTMRVGGAIRARSWRFRCVVRHEGVPEDGAVALGRAVVGVDGGQPRTASPCRSFRPQRDSAGARSDSPAADRTDPALHARWLDRAEAYFDGTGGPRSVRHPVPGGLLKTEVIEQHEVERNRHRRRATPTKPARTVPEKPGSTTWPRTARSTPAPDVVPTKVAVTSPNQQEIDPRRRTTRRNTVDYFLGGVGEFFVDQKRFEQNNRRSTASACRPGRIDGVPDEERQHGAEISRFRSQPNQEASSNTNSDTIRSSRRSRSNKILHASRYQLFTSCSVPRCSCRRSVAPLTAIAGTASDE